MYQHYYYHHKLYYLLKRIVIHYVSNAFRNGQISHIFFKQWDMKTMENSRDTKNKVRAILTCHGFEIGLIRSKKTSPISPFVPKCITDIDFIWDKPGTKIAIGQNSSRIKE